MIEKFIYVFLYLLIGYFVSRYVEQLLIEKEPATYAYILSFSKNMRICIMLFFMLIWFVYIIISLIGKFRKLLKKI